MGKKTQLKTNPKHNSNMHAEYFLTSLLAISPGVGQLVMSLKSLDWVKIGGGGCGWKKGEKKIITTLKITINTEHLN